jgi:Holliday junction DNA helicase RuvA
MIEYIKGQIAQLTPVDAVIETAGVGYLLCISLATFSKLEGQTSAQLLVHEVIREDAHTLYGFADEQERTLFRALIGVSGVGPGTARMILSSFSVDELEQIIISGDHKRLNSVKGIGAKTAQRVIVDLKDKIKPMGDTLIMKPTVTSEVQEEALAALVMLGFTRQQSQKALKKLFDDDPTIKLETAIKKALAMM